MKRLRLALIFAVFACFAGSLYAPPTWWSEEGTRIIEENGEAENYAPANLGQLKHVAKKAREHLDAKFPGGAGGAIVTLVDSFEPRAGQGYTQEQIDAFLAENYAPINLGQLKAVAKPFYDRLLEFSYGTKANLIARGYPANWAFDYPWDPQTPVSENYAPANLGQLKMVFSFDLSAPAGELPSWWMAYYFPGQTGITPEADPDGDELTNLQEYQQGGDPRDYYNGQTPVLSIVSGNNQSSPAGQPLPEPLTVEVTGTSGGGLVNAPLSFSVTGSNGQVAISESGSWGAVQEVRTGTNGRASVYLTPSGTVGAINQVQASTITEGEPVFVTFEATVADNYEKPTIRFTGGYQLATVATGSTVNFAVTVNDPDDRADKVELYAGDTKVDESSAAPFTTSWTPTLPGRFPITVKVFTGSVQTSIDAKMLHVSGTKNESLAYSPASGGMAVAFPAGTDTVASLPFQEPGVFAGRARGVGVSTIEADKSEPWAPGRFQPGDVSYVLQILDGPLEGTEYPISGNSETSVTVVGLEGGDAPAAGVRFLIRPRWAANEAVPGSLFAPAGSEDIPELKFPDTDGEGIDRPFAETWTWSSSGWEASPSSSEALLMPSDAWFVARNKTAAGTTWTPIGDVSHVSIRRPVGKELAGPHDTPLALPRPGVFSPVAAGLMSGGLLNESAAVGEPGDILLGFSSPSGAIGRTPDVTYYRHMDRLYRLGDETEGDLAESETLNGGTGWIIRRSGAPEDLFNHAEHKTP